MRDSAFLILTPDLTREMLSMRSRFFTRSDVIYEDKVEHVTLHKTNGSVEKRSKDLFLFSFWKCFKP